MGLFVKLNIPKDSKKSGPTDAEITARDAAARGEGGVPRKSPKSKTPGLSKEKVAKLQTKLNRGKIQRSPSPAAAPKTIAQDVAEVKPELPKKPLAGQGAMEGKAVQRTVVKVPDTVKLDPEKVKQFKALQEADRRVAAGRSPSGIERRASLKLPTETTSRAIASGTETKTVTQVAPKAKLVIRSTTPTGGTGGTETLRINPQGNLEVAKNVELEGAVKRSVKAPRFTGRAQAAMTRQAYKGTTEWPTGGPKTTPKVTAPETAVKPTVKPYISEPATEVAKAVKTETPTVTRTLGQRVKAVTGDVGRFNPMRSIRPAVQAVKAAATAPLAEGAGTAARVGKVAKVAGQIALRGSSAAIGAGARLAGGYFLGAAAEHGARKIYEASTTGEQTQRMHDVNVRNLQKGAAKYGLKVDAPTGWAGVGRALIGGGAGIKVSEDAELKKRYQKQMQDRVDAQVASGSIVRSGPNIRTNRKMK